MSDPLLTFLKYLFLALLYLFFLRVLRAVWVELREPKPGAQSLTPAGADAPVADGRGTRRRSRRDRANTLVVLEPVEMQDLSFDLGDELTVGRAAGCGVSLPDDTFVSQIHARVFRRDGKLWAEDLGSTNGTFLNGEKVSAPVLLHKGDRLAVGRTIMEVRAR